MTSRDILKGLKEDGWFEVRTRGDHVQLHHPSKPGTVTVQHPVKDLTKRVVRSIERQSGVRFLR